MADYTFYSNTLTCGDTAKNLDPESIPFYDANIYIYDHDVYYGSGAVQDAIAPKNTVLSFRNGDIKDVFFKNKTSGSNGRIVIVATVPVKQVLDKLRL
jgi:hypothetical protein